MLSISDALSSFEHNSIKSNANTLEDNQVKIIKAPDFLTRTLYPMTTTASVVGIKFNNGVAIAADVGGYYGSLNRFKSLDRLYKVNNNIVMTTTGDYADFQYIRELIQQKVISEEILDDSFSLKAFSLHTWLTRLMYNRRSKFDPLWNNVIVAGYDNSGPFLGIVDKLGMSYEDSCVATGMGGYLAVPLLRDVYERGKGNLTKQEAHAALQKCMEILYYRDTQSLPKFRIATVTEEGVEISPELEVEGNWEIVKHSKGF